MGGTKKKNKAAAAFQGGGGGPPSSSNASKSTQGQAKAPAKGATKASPGGKVKGAGSAPAVPLEELFVKLQGHVSKRELSKIVKAADEILQVSPGDIDALRCKLVALIQVGNYSDGLKALESAAKSASKPVEPSASTAEEVLDKELAFEKAYCLYRLNKLSEAMDILKDAEKTPGILQLEGQVLYRMGDTSNCIQRFEELIRRFRSEASSNEVKTNVIAAYVMGGRAGEVKALLETQLKVAPRDAFDIAYNVACSLIELRDFPAAEEMLLLARRVGQEVLIDEELNTQEIEEELAPITVQLAYVQQVQGRKTEALESYNAFLKRKPGDAPSVASAVNNLTALRNTKDVSDSLRRLERLVSMKKGEKGVEGVEFLDGLEWKLSATQKAVVLHNRFLLLLLSGKLDEAAQMLPLLDSLLCHCPSQLLPLHTSLLLRQGKDSASLAAELARLTTALEASAQGPTTTVGAGGSLLGPLPDGFTVQGLSRSTAPGPAGVATTSLFSAPATPTAPTSKLEMPTMPPADTSRLLTAQAAAAEGRFVEAAQELAHMECVKFEPSIVATIVDLKERAGDIDGAESTIDEAVSWWEKQASSSSGVQQVATKELVMEAAAQLKRRHGKPEAAAEIYRKLTKQGASVDTRAEAQASLVMCSALFDQAAAEKLALELPPLGTNLDAAQLEKLGSAALPSKPTKRATGDDETGGEKQRPKKKRKRKPIYPKGFDPANPGPPPDPERWLPKRERSSFKPKKRDKKKIDVRGAQGTTVNQKLDVAAGATQGAQSAGTLEKGGKGAKAPEAFSSKPPEAKKKGKKGKR